VALSVQTCAVEGCGRLVYVPVTPGSVTVYCGNCRGATLFKVARPNDEDGDGNEWDGLEE
jgi:hypothetical protein